MVLALNTHGLLEIGRGFCNGLITRHFSVVRRWVLAGVLVLVGSSVVVATQAAPEEVEEVTAVTLT